jgi:hypothetical protein
MGEGFWPGIIIGALGGILIHMLFEALFDFKSSSQTKPVDEEEKDHKHDPDWWKKGLPPPF